MLQITLSDNRAPVVTPDPLGRNRIGVAPGDDQAVIWANNRGRWKLGERATRQRYVLLVHDNVVVLAAEIHRIVPCGDDGRSAIEGMILTPGHPVHDTHVGHAPPRPSGRNPITYVDSPLEIRTCACGCGTTVDIHSDFVSGHAHQAILQRVGRAGGAVQFLAWFDQNWTEQP